MKNFRSRRDFVFESCGGISGLGLAYLLNQDGLLAAEGACATSGTVSSPLTPRSPHFAPRATSMIFLFMNGGVSHVDTFDPKPALEKYHGQPLPGGAILTQRKTGNLMKSPYKFSAYGKAGTEMSELWPNVGGVSEHLCVIRSMYADIPNHEPCITLMNTGANVIG